MMKRIRLGNILEPNTSHLHFIKWEDYLILTAGRVANVLEQLWRIFVADGDDHAESDQATRRMPFGV
jgi:hypothetical protein